MDKLYVCILLFMTAAVSLHNNPIGLYFTTRGNTQNALVHEDISKLSKPITAEWCREGILYDSWIIDKNTGTINQINYGLCSIVLLKWAYQMAALFPYLLWLKQAVVLCSGSMARGRFVCHMNSGWWLVVSRWKIVSKLV